MGQEIDRLAHCLSWTALNRIKAAKDEAAQLEADSEGLEVAQNLRIASKIQKKRIQTQESFAEVAARAIPIRVQLAHFG